MLRKIGCLIHSKIAARWHTNSQARQKSNPPLTGERVSFPCAICWSYPSVNYKTSPIFNRKHTLGIQSPPNLRNGFMEPKNTMRFGGEWIPQSSAENTVHLQPSRPPNIETSNKNHWIPDLFQQASKGGNMARNCSGNGKIFDAKNTGPRLEISVLGHSAIW